VNSSDTKIILGIDEVGRGPWAGPLVVGAVVLGSEFQNLEILQNLTDSKQLSPKRRTALAPLIHQHAAAAATGWVSAPELDQYGLSASLKLATRRAVKQILTTKIPFSEIIIDGTVNFLANTPLTDRVTLLKKADSLVKAVSAASIIAKVARDDCMINLATKYPAYSFENHVGYGTAKHKAALLEHGVCPEHRQSFRPIREILLEQGINPSRAQNTNTHSPINSYSTKAPNFDNPAKCCKDYNILETNPAQNTTSKGQHAENLVANYLQSLGHTIVAHNFKTKTYEIDLISTQNDKIYFTEVKYRQDSRHGSALEQITPTKHQQMYYAAEKFLSSHPEYANFQPLLAVASVVGPNFQLGQWFTLL